MTDFIHENILGDIELNTINENGKRLYVTPDGQRYPSVTTVLSNYNKKGIIEWRKRVGKKKRIKFPHKHLEEEQRFINFVKTI